MHSFGKVHFGDSLHNILLESTFSKIFHVLQNKKHKESRTLNKHCEILSTPNLCEINLYIICIRTTPPTTTTTQLLFRGINLYTSSNFLNCSRSWIAVLTIRCYCWNIVTIYLCALCSLSTSQRSCQRKQIWQRRKQLLRSLHSWKFHFSIEPHKAASTLSKSDPFPGLLLIHFTEGIYWKFFLVFPLCSRKIGGPPSKPLPPPREVIDHDNAAKSFRQVSSFGAPEPSVPPVEQVNKWSFVPNQILLHLEYGFWGCFFIVFYKVCPICLTNPKDMALGCGHLVSIFHQVGFVCVIISM